MDSIVQLVGPHHTVELLGIKLVGVNGENGMKLLFTVVFIGAVYVLGVMLRWAVAHLIPGRSRERVQFWSRQGIKLLLATLLIVGIASIWFEDPARLTTAIGLVTAGLAFALQKVVSAVAGYFVLLRGKIFNVGDRIVMGGVRGDVIALDFTQTTIMEMGQPPAVQSAAPAMWVHSRQYTGRIVTVPNAKIFDEPVYNFTREFPYIWEELHIPVPYSADRHRAEKILLDAAERHTVDVKHLGEDALAELERRYATKRTDMGPRVYWRITDNWLEMTLRFIVKEHGTRKVKDAMSRDILEAFDAAKIEIASGTYDIVGLPPIRVEGLPTMNRQSPERNGSVVG